MADLSEQNRLEWNKKAKSYDAEDWQKVLIKQLADFIRAQAENGFIGGPISGDVKTSKESVKLLDYACGTGAVTRALKDFATTTLGVDVSEGMVEEYTLRMKQDGNSSAKAIVGNFLSAEATPPLGSDLCPSDFSVAAVGMGFHHFHDSQLTIKRLAERLKPGGVVFIVDLVPSKEDPAYKGPEGGFAHDHGHGHGHGHSHGHDQTATEKSGDEDPFAKMGHTIAHDGFNEAMMRDLFEGASLVDTRYAMMDQPVTMLMKQEVRRTVFLARAQKP